MSDHKPSTTGLRAQIGSIAAALAVAASTLWDYRLSDVRIFDFVAAFCLLGYLVCCPEPVYKFFARRKEAVVLFTVIGAYALLGYVLHGHRSSIAIIVLGLFGFLLIGRRDWIMGHRFFAWLVIFHITWFLVQILAFEFFNIMIDYQTMAGSHSRIDHGLARGFHLIRASGLFQEANSYSLNMFVLGTILTLRRPHLPLVTLAAVTMALSQSLWGIAAACVLLLLYCVRYREAAKPVFVAGLIFAAVVNVYLWLNIRPGDSMPFVYDRAFSIFSDTSLRARFVINECPDEVRTANEALSPAIRAASVLFGQGLSTHYFRECLPANGISFLLNSLGLVGLAALLTGFWMALRGLPASAKLYAIVAIGFSFTTYPLMTYLLFWLWLAAVINLLRLAEAERGPPAG